MLILLPIGMNYRTERLPIVTFSLIGINTLVYLISEILFFSTSGQSDIWIMRHLWLIPAQSFWWMYLTSMFVHANFLHLFGNMLFLFLFGCCAEDMLGRGRFLGFYLAGGLIAELTYIAMTPAHFTSAIPMGGASGAISACMGMYLLLRADADIEFKYFFWFFFVRAGEFEIPAWIAISFWFLKDLLFALIGMTDHSSRGGVAFGAHVGGFLAGLAAIGVCKLFEPKQIEPQQSDYIELMPKMSPAIAISDSTETPTIYLHEDGAQSGPFTLSQIHAALASSEISRNALYWSEGMTDWQNVSDLG